MRWLEVMKLDDLWDGDMVGVRVDGRAVLLVNVGGEVYAFEDRCPHKASPLSEGTLEGGTLTCATHHWQFEATSGIGINPARSYLPRYDVRVEDDAILVGLSEEA